MPLRLKLRFGIGDAWLDQERSRFMWVIWYEGEDTFEEANQRYWAPPEREVVGVDLSKYLVDRDVRGAGAGDGTIGVRDSIQHGVPAPDHAPGV